MMLGIGFNSFFAPVPCAEHHDALADADNQHLEKELILIAQRYAGQRILRIPSNHDIVRQIDGIRQQVLQGNARRQTGKGFIKSLISNYTRFSSLSCDFFLNSTNLRKFSVALLLLYACLNKLQCIFPPNRFDFML